MNRSLALAGAITVAAVAWVLSGQISGSPDQRGTDHRTAAPPPPPERPEPPPQVVRVARLTARPMISEVILQGRTEAWRTVDLRAEVRGRVEAVPVERGSPVTAGQVLVRLAVYERRALLEQAKALLAQRRIEYEAARALRQRGHNTEIELAGAKTQFDAAEAALRKAEVDLANTEIRAPFDGVLDRRPVNLGDFLDIANPVALVVDLDPIRVVGFASERSVAELRPGAKGHARIIGGTEVEGTIAYVAATADTATRTFRVELEVPNPDRRIVAGLTAQLRLPVATKVAHFVSPSALSLADDGAIGVKVVEGSGPGEGRVRFLPVEIVGTTPEGVWLGGLPDEIRLITVGHEYVGAGNRVTPVEMGGPA